MPDLDDKARREAFSNLSLGELIYKLIGLKEEYKTKFVDEKFPYPENYDKYGGIAAYNNMMEIEYKQIRTELINELNERERKYNSYKRPPVY